MFKTKRENTQDTKRSKSGKTTIANFLSDSTENVGGEYRPTQGVRIVEFETQNSNINNGGFKTDVELWDCSGDLKFENFWPAIYKDANGIVFVCDLSVPDASSKLDYYFESFCLLPLFHQQNPGTAQHMSTTNSITYSLTVQLFDGQLPTHSDGILPL
ncbi:Intraflagellar transport protein 22 [Homalodisca vitripennis]|nr:Intraflagellar transport protein 22 [Homalodisca vitripennis]